MTNFFDKCLVTMFGLGKVKIIPGTIGSFVTVIILYNLFHTFNVSLNKILLVLICQILRNQML